jgi:hypothetical protein
VHSGFYNLTPWEHIAQLEQTAITLKLLHHRAVVCIMPQFAASPVAPLAGTECAHPPLPWCNRGSGAMPETSHEREAEQILEALSSRTHDGESSVELLASVLRQAEQRGRRISANEKQSSG